MRIGFFSDWHTSMNPQIDIIRELIELDSDIIIYGGDWDVVPYKITEMNLLRERVPIYSVYGNHDDPDVLRSYGILLEDGEPVFDERTGLTVCGFGGAIIRDNYSYPETWHTIDYYLSKGVEAWEKLRESLRPCDVLVFHDPPMVVVDELMKVYEYYPENVMRIDSKSYRIVFDTLIELLSPRLVLSGHIHVRPYIITYRPMYDVFNGKKSVPIINVITTIGNTFLVIDTDKNVVEVYGQRDEVSASYELRSVIEVEIPER